MMQRVKEVLKAAICFSSRGNRNQNFLSITILRDAAKISKLRQEKLCMQKIRKPISGFPIKQHFAQPNNDEKNLTGTHHKS
jgi:hypothetical protein